MANYVYTTLPCTGTIVLPFWPARNRQIHLDSRQHPGRCELRSARFRRGKSPLGRPGNPGPRDGADPARGFLKSYSLTYLQEEIRAEALTRNLGGFARFLEIAARQNGQITNVAGIARDAAVTRQSVQNWFEILVDTLLGSWLPAWKLERATKQVAHPKFYVFDSGVARALSGRLPYPPLPEERGFLLETVIRNELAAYLDYSGLDYPLTFWQTPSR